jgi:hypothetical protein
VLNGILPLCSARTVCDAVFHPTLILGGGPQASAPWSRATSRPRAVGIVPDTKVQPPGSGSGSTARVGRSSYRIAFVALQE